MRNSKIIQILRSLSNSELKRLKSYIGSTPKTSPKVLKLFNLIIKHAPGFDHEQLTKEYLFTIIFPGQKFNELKLNNQLSFLVKIVEDFLVQSIFEDNVFLKKYLLLSQYQKRNTYSVFNRTHKEAKQMLEKMPHKNDEFFRNQYLLANEADLLFVKKQQHTKDENLQEKNDFLDLFYLSSKLKYLCEMLNRERIINASFESSISEELSSYLERNINRYQQYPAITIYYNILLLLKNDEDRTTFNKVKKILEDNIGSFGQEELRGMYNYLLNHCIRQVNRGKLHFLNELLGIYQILLKTEIIYEHGYLTQWDYKNITSAALRLKEFDWTKEFLFTYKKKLQPEFRENAFKYNCAYYYYETNEPNKAIPLLNEIKFSDVYYILGTKSLLLRIYFELRDEEAFITMANSFRALLKRNQEISKDQQTNYLNLIRFSLKAFRIQMDNVEQKVLAKKCKQLEQQINKIGNVANIHWLLSKIDAIQIKSQS